MRFGCACECERGGGARGGGLVGRRGRNRVCVLKSRENGNGRRVGGK